MSNNSSQQQDIRRWLNSSGNYSSQPAPRRRRRVMSTSDSEAERSMRSHQPMTPQMQPSTAEAQESAEAATAREGGVIIVETSTDDMCAAAEGSLEQRQPNTGNLQRQLRRDAGGHDLLSPTENHHTPRARAPQRRRIRRAVEASESSALTDSDSSCVESDTNARSLYRDAILGVRNAQFARRQMRASNQSCPTCALFASFLQAFL
jgi:hypothetical protein